MGRWLPCEGGHLHRHARSPPARAPRQLANFSTALRDALEHGERIVTQSGIGGGSPTENMDLWKEAGDVLEQVDAALLDGLGLQGRRHETALAIERSPNLTLN